MQEGSDEPMAEAVGVVDPEAMYVDSKRRQLIIAGDLHVHTLLSPFN